MKATLLGTGAADGIPAFYSGTRVSRYARENGGKDVRSRCAAIVDDVLKIDLGPDTWHQLAREGHDARDWIALLITHSDDDHFSIDELQYAVYPFNVMEFFGFPIYGNQHVSRQIIERYPDWPFEVTVTKSFQPVEIALQVGGVGTGVEIGQIPFRQVAEGLVAALGQGVAQGFGHGGLVRG